MASPDPLAPSATFSRRARPRARRTPLAEHGVDRLASELAEHDDHQRRKQQQAKQGQAT